MPLNAFDVSDAIRHECAAISACMVRVLLDAVQVVRNGWADR